MSKDIRIEIILNTFAFLNTRISATIFFIVEILKTSIQIFSLQIASVITEYYTVWICYRHDPKIKHFSQLLHSLIRCQKKVYKSVYDEARESFTRMLSSHYKNDWFFLSIVWLSVLKFFCAPYLNQWHIQFPIALSNCSNLKHLILFKFLKLIKRQKMPLHV